MSGLDAVQCFNYLQLTQQQVVLILYFEGKIL